MTIFITILLIIAAYLLGSIPFGLLLTQKAGIGDIRKIGSGNIGATNVMRADKRLGIITLLLDAAKGALPVAIAHAAGADERWVYAVAFAAVLGHVFPVWLNFKGGKGVATAIGSLLGLSSGLAMFVGAAWLIVFCARNYVSLASILCFWALVAFSIIAGNFDAFLFSAALALLITWTHRANIERLKLGTEPSYLKKKP